MAGNASFLNWLRGVAGGVVGGALGYLAFFFIARQGFYAMVLPGALLGLGCGSISGFKSTGLGIVCAVSAILLSLIIELKFAPFIRDDSLSYFLSHVNELKSMTLIMIAIGGFFGFWFGKGREHGTWPTAGTSEVAD